MIRLENWSVVFREADPFKAPEQKSIGLHGRVFGHHRLPEGSEITTSSVIGRKGEVFVTSTGSHYELGAVDPEYERQFPDARARALKSVPEIPSPKMGEPPIIGIVDPQDLDEQY